MFWGSPALVKPQLVSLLASRRPDTGGQARGSLVEIRRRIGAVDAATVSRTRALLDELTPTAGLGHAMK